MKNFLRRIFGKRKDQPILEVKQMQVFSEENLKQLNDEYKFVSMSLSRLKTDRVLQREQDANVLAAAFNNLAARKVELAVMIATLEDHIFG